MIDLLNLFSKVPNNIILISEDKNITEPVYERHEATTNEALANEFDLNEEELNNIFSGDKFWAFKVAEYGYVLVQTSDLSIIYLPEVINNYQKEELLKILSEFKRKDYPFIVSYIDRELEQISYEELLEFLNGITKQNKK